MNILLNKLNQIRFLFICTLLLLLLGGIGILPHGQIGVALFILSVCIAIVGIVSGTVLALSISLILFFLIGSALLWLPFTTFAIFQDQIPLFYLLLWMGLLLMLSLITGQLSILLNQLSQENTELQNQIRNLVAVDPMTGFDNKDRMLLEINMEYNRSKRYGHTFTLVLIKINHLESFKKLYGDPELNRLLHHLSDVIYKTMRLSDLKFRPETDVIGILLTDTEVEHIQIVIDKLHPKLEIHQLANGKYVTLSLEYGFVGFNDVDDYRDVYTFAKEQVSEYVS